MSRRSIRTLVGSALASVSGITVLTYIPKSQPLVDIAVVSEITHIEAIKSTPRSSFGGGGHRFIDYIVKIIIATSDPDEETAAEHEDDIVQTIIQALRAQPIDVLLIDTTSIPNEHTNLKKFADNVKVQTTLVQQLSQTGSEANVYAASLLTIDAQEDLVGIGAS